MSEPHLHVLLRALVGAEGSDLHLSPGIAPRIRVHGDMVPLKMDALPGDTVDGLLQEIMDEELLVRWLGKEGDPNAQRATDLDFAYDSESDELGRFRVNAYHSRRGVGAVLRTIPTRIPSAAELRLPPAIANLARLPNGLVLVTGPTGSGKTTTLAALIDQINQERPGHILTIEDPVEFTHTPKQSVVTHREVGADVPTFYQGLRAALREDPDVIVVGELRDAETMQLALSAAETGHLVFGTLHTNSAMKTMTRVVDMVPSERQNQVRTQFADVLRGVVTQRLVKKRGGGRLGAYEILLNNDAVANSIRENKPSMIESAMNDRATGMQTLERALAQFVIQHWLDAGEAQHAANDVSKLQEEIDALRRPAGPPAAQTAGAPASRPSWMNATGR